MWYLNLDGRRNKDGYARPSVGGQVGDVGRGAVVLFMFDFQEGEVVIRKWLAIAILFTLLK